MENRRNIRKLTFLGGIEMEHWVKMGSISYFIFPFKSCLSLFCWAMHYFLFLTITIFRGYVYTVNHFQPRLTLFIDYMIILNSITCDENISWGCSNHRQISARLTVIKFLHIFVILFLHCFCLSNLVSVWRVETSVLWSENLHIIITYPSRHRTWIERT